MTLQINPVPKGLVGTGPTDYDRRILGVANTSRPTFTLREPLDDVVLVMRFAWQQSADCWVQDLRTTGGDTIRLGVGLVASGVDLWACIASDARMPGGQLWVSWGDGRTRRPGRDAWTGDARLYYRPAALRAALAGTERALV